MTVWIVVYTIGFVAVVANILFLWRTMDRLEAGGCDQPVEIEVRADGCSGYHLAILKPGESSQLPAGLLADLLSSRKATVARRTSPGSRP